MTVREEICRKLMGKAANNWATSFETLTPTQIMHGVELLERQAYSVGELNWCHHVLTRWGWFRLAGLATKPPWEITEEDFHKLTEIAPWNAPRKKGRAR